MRMPVNKCTLKTQDFHSRSAVDMPIGIQTSCQSASSPYSAESNRGASTGYRNLMFGQDGEMPFATTSSTKDCRLPTKAAPERPFGLWADPRGMISIEYALFISVVITFALMDGFTVRTVLQNLFTMVSQVLLTL